MSEANEAKPETKVDLLSPREVEVLRGLSRGYTNREIAGALGISVKTIDTHRGHLLKKLALRNNADLTRFAIRHGLCEVEEFPVDIKNAKPEKVDPKTVRTALFGPSTE